MYEYVVKAIGRGWMEILAAADSGDTSSDEASSSPRGGLCPADAAAAVSGTSAMAGRKGRKVAHNKPAICHGELPAVHMWIGTVNAPQTLL